MLDYSSRMMGKPILRLVPLVLLLSIWVAAQDQPAPYDLVISGGALYDGDGSPAASGDVGVRGGKIVRIGSPGELAGATATRRIDATGLAVAPGFIDMHNHSDFT